MASLTRSEAIAEAKYRAGVETIPFSLNSYLDKVLKDVTSDFPILKNKYVTGTLTAHASNNYLTAPNDMRDIEHLKCGASSTQVDILDPELFDMFPLTFGASLVPTRAKFVLADAKIYLNPFPSSAPGAYHLWYNAFHPPLAGDNFRHCLGEEFDETVVLGLAHHVARLAEKRDLSVYLYQQYAEDMKTKASVKIKRMMNVEFSDY